MRYHYSTSDIVVLLEDVWAFAWSAPMRDLAKKLSLSDVGLKKLLASVGVSPPPQGYWNKVWAGRAVPGVPGLSPRRPGETGRVRLDSRFAKVLEPATPWSSAGPFASPAVPENLDDLLAHELKAIGRVAAPRNLDRPHAGLLQVFNQEERRREKNVGHDYAWDAPIFDNPLGKRRLRILNGLFHALAKRNHHGDVSEQHGELHPRAIIGDTYLGLRLIVVARYRKVVVRGYERPDPELPVSTKLALQVDPDFDGKPTVSWQDDEEGTLESRIASIAAGIIVAGEAKFRRSIQEAEDRQLRLRAEREVERLAHLAKLNEQRLAELHRSGDLLRRAQDIRLLVERTVTAIDDAALDIEPDVMADWRQWALAEADKLDPLLSGQVFKHLRKPTLISDGIGGL